MVRCYWSDKRKKLCQLTGDMSVLPDLYSGIPVSSAVPKLIFREAGRFPRSSVSRSWCDSSSVACESFHLIRGLSVAGVGVFFHEDVDPPWHPRGGGGRVTIGMDPTGLFPLPVYRHCRHWIACLGKSPVKFLRHLALVACDCGPLVVWEDGMGRVGVGFAIQGCTHKQATGTAAGMRQGDRRRPMPSPCHTLLVKQARLSVPPTSYRFVNWSSPPFPQPPPPPHT